MANIYNVPPGDLIEEAAEELKKIEFLKPPEWGAFVKTGAHKERPPIREDWWYVRAASILRKVYRHGPIGVSKLRTYYGGKKNRGVKPERFYKASGNIIRKIMQQLAKADLIKEAEKGTHKGKVITPKGILVLSKAAGKVKSSIKEKGKEKTPGKTESVKDVKEKKAEDKHVEKKAEKKAEHEKAGKKEGKKAIKKKEQAAENTKKIREDKKKLKQTQKILSAPETNKEND